MIQVKIIPPAPAEDMVQITVTKEQADKIRAIIFMADWEEDAFWGQLTTALDSHGSDIPEKLYARMSGANIVLSERKT